MAVTSLGSLAMAVNVLAVAKAAAGVKINVSCIRASSVGVSVPPQADSKTAAPTAVNCNRIEIINCLQLFFK
jgi:hypothetical protein